MPKDTSRMTDLELRCYYSDASYARDKAAAMDAKRSRRR